MQHSFGFVYLIDNGNGKNKNTGQNFILGLKSLMVQKDRKALDLWFYLPFVFEILSYRILSALCCMVLIEINYTVLEISYTFAVNVIG